MKSIRLKILMTFIATFLVISVSAGILLSWRIDAVFKEQSITLSDALSSMVSENLVGYQKILESAIVSTRQEMMQTSENIARHPLMMVHAEMLHVAGLTDLLDSYKTDFDFLVLFDLEGNYMASYPSDVGGNVDIHRIENYYKSWELDKRVKSFLKNGALQKQNKPNEHELSFMTEHGHDFIEAFKLTNRNFSGDRFISSISAAIVKDDFQDPIAVLITGKMLNDFDLPLKAFYEATGLPSAIYSGMYPIIHTGFGKENAALTGELQIRKELIKKVYESDKPIQTGITLAGISYCTICSVIKDADGRKIGILLMAMPKGKIIESKERFLSSSIEAKRNFQTWFNGFRAIALVVFVIVSWVISTTIANPINIFTRKVRAMAKGDLSIRTEMKRKDEIGVLSNAIDNMAEDLEATQAQLVQSAKLASIGELASGVAHELNQPLMVIRGNAQLINRSLRKGGLDPDKLIKRLEPVERNTKRMMNIIDHLRTFSRQSQTAFQPLNLNKIIDESFLMVGEQLRIRDIEVKLDLDADLPKVKGDGNQLEQVFLNLITNARDAITSNAECRMQNAECKGRIEIITKKGELPNQQSTIQGFRRNPDQGQRRRYPG